MSSRNRRNPMDNNREEVASMPLRDLTARSYQDTNHDSPLHAHTLNVDSNSTDTAEYTSLSHETSRDIHNYATLELNP